MPPDPNRPVFISLPPLDIADYASFLRERRWRLEVDDTMEFGYLCFAPANPEGGSGWTFREAVITQSEWDLRNHFDHLFAVHHLSRLPPLPPAKEDPGAEHPAHNPG